ncbi:MAG TPA: hypothetical protein VN659_02085 [Pyrinomonadaceae bacterium]|nr:hypothetical protein [Pyrinomonadaceae bacterium]
MALVDLTKPGEKKKLIFAAVLGLGAILVLYWALIGFDSRRPVTKTTTTASAKPQSTTNTTRPAAAPASQQVLEAASMAPIEYLPVSYNAPEAKRNIFAFYEPPPPSAPVATPPTPTPTPPPPILLASVSPSNVYARTGDFKLEAAGDKFTPDMRIFIDGRELPTTYKGPQQLSTTIAASLIANPGARQIVVRTPDNRLYSNELAINIAPPPTPNYTYIGIIGKQDRVTDTALVQDRTNRNITSVYRGDVIGGRFRVTSMSEKELVVVDTSLKIKHVLPMTEGDKSGGALARPTPKVDAEDDEP